MTLKKHRSIGFSLMEVMLVLLVVAGIFFLAATYFRSAQRSGRVSEAMTMINTVVKASYQWVQGASNFQNVSLDALVKTGYLPVKSYQRQVLNPWHGALRLSGAEGREGEASYQHVMLTMTQVPYTACLSLSEHLQKAAVSLSCDKADRRFQAIF